jgi:hypothetical protein
VTSSVMSIPASMAISKMRVPEMDEPVTRGRVTVDRGLKDSPVRWVILFPKIKNLSKRGKCIACVQSRRGFWIDRCGTNSVCSCRRGHP